MRTLDPRERAGGDVLLVAPHPDDEALGCGGTVHALAAAGAAVCVVVMARGDGGVDGRTSADGRQDESRRACEALKTEPPRFLDWSSPQLREAPADAARALETLLDGRRFDTLLVPAPFERHDTHRACTLAALLADVAAPDARWYGYGVWDALPAVEEVVEIDITAGRVAKTRAVAAHESQDGPRPLAAGMMGRDLSQAVYSRITGDEPRKAVERLMELDALVARLPPVGERDERGVREALVAWLGERGRAWAETLWG